VRVFNPFSLVNQCSCSREKIKGILEGFPIDERNKMIKNKYISVTCEFCSTTYRFKLQEFPENKT
ncbi:Hsp33 family molecular chaperone HslO, partial [Bartonella bovis]